MPQGHKISFLIVLSLVFLLPIFFIPGGAFYLDTAKSALLVLGVVATTLVFLLETWQEGKLNIPWHPFVLVAALMPLVYLLSALLTTPSSLSLFGYNFEVGTFGYILLGSTLLILMSMIFTNNSRIFQALIVFLSSFSLVAVFVAIKILLGLSIESSNFLVWGIFFSNTDNPIGRWTDLAAALGLLSVLSTLMLGMVPMKKSLRLILYGAFGLSTALLVIVNFFTALVFTLGASVILFFYFLKVEKHFFSTASTLPQASAPFILKPIFLPIVLGVVSILFLINPNISLARGTLSDLMARTFKVENTEVRPSFSATLGISKAVLSQNALLGSGPNTFSHDWLVYKPVDVNTTPFWAVAFPFGIGFIPTQVASTGILGTLLWLAFFVFFILLGVKAWNHIPESRSLRFTLVSAFLTTLFLWVSSFLYVPSGTMLMLAFMFSGIFLAVSRETGIISSRVINLKEFPQTRFISILLLVVVTIGALFLGWTGFEKTVSAFYFKKAIDLSNTAGVPLEEIESQLDKVLKFAPADLHYVALSRINFAKAQGAVNNTTDTPEKSRAIFEDALRGSIEAAKNAVSINPAGYQNWVSLGMIYSALVPAPLAVEGAYENAKFAYSEALKRNPANPELPLLLARLELNKGDIEATRSFIRSSIALKEDYADAYLMLAQLEIQEGNTADAIASTERLAFLVPNNPGIYFELGLLKYSNRDYKGAVEVLSQALALVSDYANAQYYLGLSLSRLNRLDEALRQFEALAITNPDNREIKTILLELRAGKTSFLNK